MASSIVELGAFDLHGLTALTAGLTVEGTSVCDVKVEGGLIVPYPCSLKRSERTEVNWFYTMAVEQGRTIVMLHVIAVSPVRSPCLATATSCP